MAIAGDVIPVVRSPVHSRGKIAWENAEGSTVDSDIADIYKAEYVRGIRKLREPCFDPQVEGGNSCDRSVQIPAQHIAAEKESEMTIDVFAWF